MQWPDWSLPTDNLHYLKSPERERLQWQFVERAVRYAEAGSPYYYKLFKEHSIQHNTVGSFADFEAIPFTTKKDLQLHNEEFLCVDRKDVADYCSTSGTLGNPVHILLTDNDLERLAHNEYNGFRMAGITSDSCIQLTTTIDRQFMAGLAYVLGARKLGAGLIRNGSGAPGLQLDSIHRFQPDVLIAVPSFVVKLTEYAASNSFDLQSSSVRKIICIGENIRDEHHNLNALGSRIYEAWPVQLISTYASTEMQTCFTECSIGNGGHLQSHLVYPEVVDDSGKRVPDGTYGELVITTLGVQGMPLLRYKTGDVCSLHSDVCACGRTSPRISFIAGRKMQMLKVKGTTLFPNAVSQVLESSEWVSNFVILADHNQLGGDELNIRLSLHSGAAPAALKQVSDKLEAVLRLKPALQLATFEEIEQMRWKEGGRKPVKFIDRRDLNTPNERGV